MIQPAYCSFEQSKLLKEKGFNQSTIANFWILAKDHSENYKKGLPINESKAFFCKNSDELSNKTRIDEEYYQNTYHVLSVPEQYIVIEWFRIVHGIWICVHEHGSMDKEGIFYESFVKAMAFSGYLTPQEAYLAAIDYILKELI